MQADSTAMSDLILQEHDLGLTWVHREAMARASHALVDDERVWLIDPTDEDEALDRVAALGEPAGVLQLLDRHNRACAQVARRLQVPHIDLPEVLPQAPFDPVWVVRRKGWNEVALDWPGAPGARSSPRRSAPGRCTRSAPTPSACTRCCACARRARSRAPRSSTC